MLDFDQSRNANSSSSSSSSKGGLCLSAWQLDSQQQLHLKFALGKPLGMSVMQKLVVGWFGGGVGGGGGDPWQVVFSPLLEYVAIVTSWHRWV
jgi:hypothetical protein